VTSGMGTSLRLHIPAEPPQRENWLARVLGGVDLARVLGGTDGLTEWLWQRWEVLQSAGWSRSGFDAVVLAYRRELWLWMAGERTWAQCCSGLLGRLFRRFPA
jgi:hypothetical protein